MFLNKFARLNLSWIFLCNFTRCAAPPHLPNSPPLGDIHSSQRISKISMFPDMKAKASSYIISWINVYFSLPEWVETSGSIDRKNKLSCKCGSTGGLSRNLKTRHNLGLWSIRLKADMTQTFRRTLIWSVEKSGSYRLWVEPRLWRVFKLRDRPPVEPHLQLSLFLQKKTNNTFSASNTDYALKTQHRTPIYERLTCYRQDMGTRYPRVLQNSVGLLLWQDNVALWP